MAKPYGEAKTKQEQPAGKTKQGKAWPHERTRAAAGGKPDRDNNEDSNERSQYPTWAGYTGTIYDSKNKSSNYDVMHETFHMLGFSDRYNQKTGKAFGGYENDLMGTYGAMNASYNYYKIIKSYVERHTQPPYRVYPGNAVIDKYFPQGKGNGILKY